MRALGKSLLVVGWLLGMLGCSVLRTEHRAEYQPGEKGVAYFLPTNYVKLTVTDRPPEAKAEEPPAQPDGKKAAAAKPAAPPRHHRVDVTILPAVPDYSHLYVAKPQHYAQRDDEVEIETTPDGLLTSLTITTTDRSGEIIAQLAKLAVKVAQFVSGVPPAPGVKTTDAAGQPCEDYWNEFIFDPSNDTELAALRDDLAKTCSPFAVTIETIGEPKAKLGATRPDVLEGVFYRRPRLYRFSAENKQHPTERYEQIFESLAGGPVFSLEYESGLFVERKFEAAFDGGQLKRAKSTKPSEILAVVTLPLTIIEAVGDSLGSLLQINVKNTTEEQPGPPDTSEPLEKPGPGVGGEGPAKDPASSGSGGGTS